MDEENPDERELPDIPYLPDDSPPRQSQSVADQVIDPIHINKSN